MDHNVVLNGLLFAVWLMVALLVFQRWLESKGMTYGFEDLENGRLFSFQLGIYRGKIRLVRCPECRMPQFRRRFDGWEITFPMPYTDEQMDCYLLHHSPPPSNNTSHSKDLDVYREVIIKQNEGLSCIDGKLCSIP